eukprot:TRINITY_DN5531_c0_g1_i1.p1 TRINITY_DN5531_c0_g1~~TRINITY_DN5531_c0_g1_i1.p1  ORF type:complete len:506 (+),score=176.53 TRINITY_DN5531_c0_g1_i1:107-1519(+)
MSSDDDELSASGRSVNYEFASPVVPSNNNSKDLFMRLEHEMKTRDTIVRNLHNQAREEFETKSNQLINLSIEIKSLKEEISSLQHKLSQSDSKVNEAFAMASEQFNRENKTLQKRIEVKTEEFRRKSEKMNEEKFLMMEKIKELESNVDLLRHKNSKYDEALRKERERLKETNKSLEDSKNESTKLEEMNNSFKIQLESVHKDHKLELDKSSSKISSLVDQLSRLINSENMLTSAKKEIQSLKNQLNQSNDSSKELKYLIDEMRGELVQLAQAASDKLEERERNESFIIELQRQLCECNEQLAKLRDIQKEASNQQEPMVRSGSVGFSCSLDAEEFDALVEDGKMDLIRSLREDNERLRRRGTEYNQEIVDLRKQLAIKQKNDVEIRKDFDKAVERYKTELAFKEQEIRSLMNSKSISDGEQESDAEVDTSGHSSDGGKSLEKKRKWKPLLQNLDNSFKSPKKKTIPQRR